MVEHATVNRRVVGSSPTRGAIYEKRRQILYLTAFLLSFGAYVLP
jgi:hypothetical protein